MPLTPEQIEQRTFLPAVGGYDPGEVRGFLSEVAATLRMAFHSTRPPGVDSPPAPARASDPADPVAALGSEVEGILRAAGEVADSWRRQAEAEIEEQQRAAADQIRADEARARRVLVAAQEQAEAIRTEAEARARAVVQRARDEAEAHSEHVAEAVAEQAAMLLRHEQETLRRLHEAKVGLDAAVGAIESAPSGTVVDLTTGRPVVQMGKVRVEVGGDNSGDGCSPAPTSRDPVTRMGRAAVDRAAEHPLPAERVGGAPVPTPG